MPNENPSPRKGLHPCGMCHGWGKIPLEPTDSGPMYDTCPVCNGDKWIEEQLELDLA
jgi:excinuclease UvrABC ATPase subunit